MCEFIVTENENVQYAYSLYLYRVPEGKILSQHQYFAPETLHALGTFIANASNFIRSTIHFKHNYFVYIILTN